MRGSYMWWTADIPIVIQICIRLGAGHRHGRSMPTSVRGRTVWLL